MQEELRKLSKMSESDFRFELYSMLCEIDQTYNDSFITKNTVKYSEFESVINKLDGMLDDIEDPENKIYAIYAVCENNICGDIECHTKLQKYLDILYHLDISELYEIAPSWKNDIISIWSDIIMTFHDEFERNGNDRDVIELIDGLIRDIENTYTEHRSISDLEAEYEMRKYYNI